MFFVIVSDIGNFIFSKTGLTCRAFLGCSARWRAVWPCLGVVVGGCGAVLRALPLSSVGAMVGVVLGSR